MVELSVPELNGQNSFECGSRDGPLKTSLVTMWEVMKPLVPTTERFLRFVVDRIPTPVLEE